MSGDLTNQTPKDSYKDLIQIKNSNQGVNTSFNPITDGLGNQTALSLSTSGVSIESGLLFKNVEITASPEEINSLDRSYPDGASEPNKAIITDSAGSISTSGGSINMASASSSTPYGSLSNTELGNHSNTLTVHSGITSTTSVVIDAESGCYHKIILRNSKSQISLAKSNQMVNDSTSAVSAGYYLKLFFEQGHGAPHEWAWTTATNASISWEPTFPSGYGPSGSVTAYTSGIPLINDSDAIYSGGVSGNHTAVSGEVDIVELYSIDGGDNWFAKRVASGLV